MLKAKTTKLELTGDLAGHWVEVREFTWGEIKAIRAADLKRNRTFESLPIEEWEGSMYTVVFAAIADVV